MASTPTLPPDTDGCATSPLTPLSVLPSSLGSHLLPNEEVLSLCPNVGLYAGTTKLPQQQDGTSYLTSHRIIYIDGADPRAKSGYLRLDQVKVTEHYGGFLKSSPKVILGIQLEGQEARDQYRAHVAKAQDDLASTKTNGNGHVASPAATSERWICTVCSFSNAADASTSPEAQACQLCGVKRDLRATASSNTTSTPTRPRTASSRAPLSAPLESSPAPKSSGPEIPCPTCTFLNHPSMPRCEICDSPMGTEVIPSSAPRPQTAGKTNAAASALVTRSTTPAVPAAPVETTVKLSFRKGGDKAFYDALSIAMRRGAWKRSDSQQAGTSSQTSTPGSPAPSNASASKLQRPSSNSGLRQALLTGSSSALVDIDGRRSASYSDLSSAESGAGTPSGDFAQQQQQQQRVVGIDGLLTAYSSRSAAQSSDMSTALRDLRGLMAKAKEMVDLAENLNSRLTRREAEASQAGTQAEAIRGQDGEELGEEAAATLIRSSLVKLGLPTKAITKEMAKDEDEYHEELARELAHVLLGGGSVGGRGGERVGLMGKGRVAAKGQTLPPSTTQLSLSSSTSSALPDQRSREILGLDEIWVLWNRLRGIALLSPSVLLAVVTSRHLPAMTQPSIRMRTFQPSGLKVLHTPRFDDATFARRVVRQLRSQEIEEEQLSEAMRRSRLSQMGEEEAKGQEEAAAAVPLDYGQGLSPLHFAQQEGISILLVQELLNGIETSVGAIVRDSGGEGGGSEGASNDATTVWYRNRFEELAVVEEPAPLLMS